MSLWMAFDPVWSPEWVWLRYATALRATMVLLVLAAVALLLRRARASVRAGLWAAVLLSVLPLSGVRALLPVGWSVHLVPGVLATPMLAAGSTMVEQSWPGALRLPWTMALGIVWALGAVLLVVRLLGGWVALRRLARRAHVVEDASWLTLLDEARGRLDVRREVRLLRSGAVGTPLTWGTLWPTVLLPASADAWPIEHRRAVLLHELAHVSRLDCMLALLTHWTCITWWFHPGIWWAAGQLTLERERACDERVLAAGVRRSDYAECLLRIEEEGRGLRSIGPAVVAAGLLRRSHLRTRLRDILDSRRVPGAGTGRLAPMATAIASVALVLGVGTMRLGPQPQVLWAALGSASWSTRAYAAESIARFGDPESLARLQSVLAQEPNPRVPAMARFGTRLRERSPRAEPPLGWPRPQPARRVVLTPE